MTLRRHHSERGAAAVELALISPLLILLLFGIIVFGWTFFRAQSMQAAVREGGRLAAVGIDQDTIRERVYQSQMVVGYDPSNPAPTAAEINVGFERDGAPVGGGERPCRDTDRDAEIVVSVALVDPTSHQLWIPLFGPVGPDYSYQAVFRCE